MKDTVTGLKHVFGATYLEVMNAIKEAIHAKYRLQWPPPDDILRLIKKADHAAGATEGIHLMNFAIEDYRRRVRRNVFALPNAPPWNQFLISWPCYTAKKRFLAELLRLSVVMEA